MPEAPRFTLGPTLYDLLIETFAVVLGVSIALLANEWQTGRADRARAEAARASIVQEIHANRAEVAHSRDYHARLMGTIQPELGPDGAAPGLDVFTEGFINPAEILTTAWDVAGATDALAHMDYDEVLTFSRLYARQRRYEDATREGGRVIYGQLIERGTNGVAANYRNLYALISATWFLENGLLTEYDRVLAAVDSAAG